VLDILTTSFAGRMILQQDRLVCVVSFLGRGNTGRSVSRYDNSVCAIYSKSSARETERERQAFTSVCGRLRRIVDEDQLRARLVMVYTVVAYVYVRMFFLVRFERVDGQFDGRS
jgi:hypothetical protein